MWLCCICCLQVPGPALSGLDHLQGLAEAMSCEHVLTGSRCATAQAVAAAIACNMPVLLEGPAAVGKTSLVSAIARFMPQQQVLERVNNTESTDLQVSSVLIGSTGAVAHVPVNRGVTRGSLGHISRFAPYESRHSAVLAYEDMLPRCMQHIL